MHPSQLPGCHKEQQLPCSLAGAPSVQVTKKVRFIHILLPALPPLEPKPVPECWLTVGTEFRTASEFWHPKPSMDSGGTLN